MGREPLPPDIAEVVARALAEDLGTGDLTAALIDAAATAAAEVRVREAAVLCGRDWFDEAFRQLDPGVRVDWRQPEGADVASGAVVCTLSGRARSLLTGERTALNFLQMLSGTATAARHFAAAVAGTSARILDTRKTLPGLRFAQKYAVRCGGAHNHRLGLYDGILIKENHIVAAGGIEPAVRAARANASSVLVEVEVEVETLEQVRAALDLRVDRLLLDNFTLEDLRAAVALRDGHPGPRKELEASGGFELESLRAVAETGVDFISCGALTKHVHAVDFSMRFV